MPKDEKKQEDQSIGEVIEDLISDESVDNNEEFRQEDSQPDEDDETHTSADDDEDEDGDDGEESSDDGETKDGDDSGDDLDEDDEGEKVGDDDSDDDSDDSDESDDESEESLAEQNARLLALVEQLSDGQPPQTVHSQEQAGEVKDQPQPQSQPTPVDVSQPVADAQKVLLDFLGDKNVDDIIETKESFNGFMQDFATKLNDVTVTNLLTALPGIVRAQVAHYQTLAEARETFYDANQDLRPVKKYVGRTLNEVAAEHADWPLPQLLEETAKRVRTSLGIIKKAKQVDTKIKRKKPALPGKNTGARERGKAPSRSKLQKQVDSILD